MLGTNQGKFEKGKYFEKQAEEKLLKGFSL